MAQGLKLVILGTAGSNPFAGMTWMHVQFIVGLLRLGHDVHYVEVTSQWPYDPVRRSVVGDPHYAVSYLARIAERFGLGDRWAYRPSYAHGEWLGPGREHAEELLAKADAVLNIAGATRPAEEGLPVSRLVLVGTDPLLFEIRHANGDQAITSLIDEHDDVVTYAENLATPFCPVPPLPRLRARMRQPVLVDMWADGEPSRLDFTTVCNWRQSGRDVRFDGTTYYWSKHREFGNFLDVPRRTGQRIELAIGRLATMNGSVRSTLESNGWNLVDAHDFTTDPFAYMNYVQKSRAEFTVAKDLHVRLQSGWFSERSACYLAAGRPVVTQDTGFGTALPTGEGLFAFSTADDIAASFDAIQSDYRRHSRAARAIAEEYFSAEVVLAKLLSDLGL